MATRGGSSAGVNPVARWEEAMKRLYLTSPTARKKGCPRGAFLGLCEEGLFRRILARPLYVVKRQQGLCSPSCSIVD